MTNYNLSMIYEQTNPLMMLVAVNTLSEHFFANFIMLCVFIIVWVANSQVENSHKMVLAGFVTTFIGVMLMFLEMTTFGILVIPFCIFVVGALVKAFKGN